MILKMEYYSQKNTPLPFITQRQAARLADHHFAEQEVAGSINTGPTLDQHWTNTQGLNISFVDGGTAFGMTSANG